MWCEQGCMIKDVEGIVPIGLIWQCQCYLLTRYAMAAPGDESMRKISHGVRDAPVRSTCRDVERCRSGIKENSVRDDNRASCINVDQYMKQRYKNKKKKEAAENKHPEMHDQEFLLHWRHSFIKNDQFRR